MSTQPPNAYHMDGRFNSHNYGHYGTSSLGSHRFYQLGSAPGVPVSSGIPSTPSNVVYKLSPLEEVKKRLVQGHLSYLNRDETPEKLAHKTKLESLILEYLSMVPHCNKFDNIEVAECFDKSIIENENFTASRAASAFEVLEKFATSLLTKPWRKEFRTIYPYGGYLKGLVDKQLRGASNILYLMGYRNKNVNGVICYSAESSIIDPDTLARVSLDCLIAFVECQMMVEIADTLKRKNVYLSWLQILDIRANSICSMDQLINYVLDSDKLIDFETDPSFNLHSAKYGRLSHPNASNKRLTGLTQPSQYHQNGCPALRENRKKNDLPSLKDFVNNQNPDNPRSRDLMHFSMEETRSPNVIYHGIHTPTGFIAPPSMFASEFANVPYSENHQAFNLPKYPPYLHVQQQQQLVSSSTPSQSLATKPDSEFNKNGMDFIDGGISGLNLKSTGSRLRNLDRCTPISTSTRANPSTVLSSHDPVRSDESNNHPDLDTNIALNNHTVNNNSSNNNTTNKRLEDRINAILKSFSDEDKSKKSCLPNEESNERVSEKKIDQKRISKNRDKTHDRANETFNSRINDKSWSCAYCTFLNTNQTEICDMCSRSRDLPESKLLSGGRVCPVCTLVNSKDATRCSACEHSLLNSPTYI